MSRAQPKTRPPPIPVSDRLDLVMEIYLCRHAQEMVDDNNKDDGITELGQEQALAMARFLSKKSIKILYSSDLPRALDTAKVVSAALNLKISVSPKLREIKTTKKAWREYVRTRHTDFDFHPGGGESVNDLIERARRGWNEIVKGSGGENTAVVCHGIFIKALLYGLGYKDYLIRNDHVANTGVTILQYEGGKVKLVKFNSYKHLLPLRVKEAVGSLGRAFRRQ